ncbi:hypothetical protein NSP_53000 [Nodularia spumigena CCY9414]|nr:hypothetical protein NSP_53000 [Nodularia spumigena CCY9414]
MSIPSTATNRIKRITAIEKAKVKVTQSKQKAKGKSYSVFTFTFLQQLQHRTYLLPCQR